MAAQTEEHLRRFLTARRAGDAPEMRRWWGELVIDFYDRMSGFVGIAHQGRLNHDEHELAVQLAMIRFSGGLMESFEGVSVGQLVNATKQLATYICMDVQRRAIRDRERQGRSLESGWDADAEDRPSGAWEAEEAAARFDRDERSADVVDFLGWALPQLSEARRAVMERTFHGAELPEICEELGLSSSNAYQHRSRGYKELAKLKERYEQ